MKRCMALLLCVWLFAAGAFAVTAESTTVGDVTQTEIVTQTTIYYEEVEVEVLEKVQSPFPGGMSLALIIVGGMFVLVAIALLCVFLFAFPRWGLVKLEKTKAEENEEGVVLEDAVLSEEDAEGQAEDGEEAPATVSLQDLF